MVGNVAKRSSNKSQGKKNNMKKDGTFPVDILNP
jgi:hypothetical protein